MTTFISLSLDGVEIIRLRPEKDLVNLRTMGLNPDGEAVCEGEALVWSRDLDGSE